MSLGAFSVGFNFQYWESKWCKKDDPYFVDKKYDNLKEEIMNYYYLSIKLYKKEIIPKAQQYHKSQIVKSIKAPIVAGDKYGISYRAVVSVSHLICIILYTDYTNLSTDFSATFRKNDAFETLTAVKKRNQKYYFFAKGLKEVVAVYGQRYDDERGGIGLLPALKGPFFCGMSFILMMPAFNIQIFGPVSTSVHQEIAVKFSGDNGIIIRFDNHKGWGKSAQGFDVSFISRYGGDEDER